MKIVLAIFIFALGAYIGAVQTSNRLVDDCQKKTYFTTSRGKFECMKWTTDYEIVWDKPPKAHVQPPMVPH